MFVKEFVRVIYEENSPGVGDRSQTVEAVSEDNLVCQSVCVAAHAIKQKNDNLAAIIVI